MNEDASERLFVNKEEVDAMIMDLYNKIDTITSILNQFKYKVYDINDYYTGPTADVYQKKLNRLILQIGTIKDNLNTYTKDLMAVKEMYEKLEKRNINTIEGAIAESRARTSAIEEKKVETELNLDNYMNV